MVKNNKTLCQKMTNHKILTKKDDFSNFGKEMMNFQILDKKL